MDFKATVTFRFGDFRNVLRILFQANRLGSPINNLTFFDLDLAVLSGEVTELDDGTQLDRDDATLKMSFETNDRGVFNQMIGRLNRFQV